MVRLMDCTLRDGANVVGKGFDAEITKIVLDILTESNVPIIEFGNAGGIGAYEVAGFTNALTDMEYLDLVQPYLGKSEIGMFLNAKRFREPNVELAASKGMKFLRCGADAGDARKISEVPVKTIKNIRQIFGGNSFPIVLQFHLNKITDVLHPQVNPRPLLIHIFQRIRHNIVDDSL